MRCHQVVAAGILLVAFAGCSDEQKRDVEGALIRDALREVTLDVLAGAELEIGDLDCAADIAEDSSVTGTCRAETTDGDPVAAGLDGTVDTDDVSCSADVAVTVADRTLAEQSGWDCLEPDDFDATGS